MSMLIQRKAMKRKDPLRRIRKCSMDRRVRRATGGKKLGSGRGRYCHR